MNQLHFQNVLRGKKVTFVVIFFQNLKIRTHNVTYKQATLDFVLLKDAYTKTNSLHYDSSTDNINYRCYQSTM